MITKNVEGKYELDIFMRFLVDRTLPKYKTIQEYSVSSIAFNDGPVWVTGSSNSTSDGRKPTLFNWILSKISDHKKKKAKQLEDMSKVPVEVIFKNVIEDFKSIKVLEDRLNKHRNAIKYAENMGQTALVEDLRKKQKSVELEEVLFTAGYKQYIEEQSLISFALNCEKGLRLDWIKNFTRLIPIEGGEKKMVLDKLCVFDNYVILHYDPYGNSTKLTDEERKKKEDPILFGVIEGSRKLYHVHSWIDELCNLTIEQIIEKHPEAIKVVE
jgi:hypothetical protein